jgi:hypothetical protein
MDLGASDKKATRWARFILHSGLNIAREEVNQRQGLSQTRLSSKDKTTTHIPIS